MLLPQTPADIQEWLNRFERCATEMKNLKLNMLDSGHKQVELNTLKADKALEYLEGWASDCGEKFLKMLRPAEIRCQAQRINRKKKEPKEVTKKIQNSCK
ncbi:MAG: hypothetical protein QM811_16520 [Pirellulales bacterium]